MSIEKCGWWNRQKTIDDKRRLCHSSFVVRHSSFVVRRSSFVGRRECPPHQPERQQCQRWAKRCGKGQPAERKLPCRDGQQGGGQQRWARAEQGLSCEIQRQWR